MQSSQIDTDNFSDQQQQVEGGDEQIFRQQCQRATGKVTYSKQCNRNAPRQIMRLFSVPGNFKLQLKDPAFLRKDYTALLLQSCYVFRFKVAQKGGYTHAIFIKLYGQLPRRVFNTFTYDLLKFITNGALDCEAGFTFKAATPIVTNSRSLFDYLQTLYGTSTNLLINCPSNEDLLPFNGQSSDIAVNHEMLNSLTKRLKDTAVDILDNIMSMPSMYPDTKLYQILQFTPAEYKDYMRFNTLDNIVLDICNTTYAIAFHKLNQIDTAAQKKGSTTNPTLNVQLLLDPITRMSLVNEFATDRVTKRIQALFQQTFTGSSSYIHPSPCSFLGQSILQQYGVFDGFIFDPRFLISLLMCSRWFARVCLQDPTNVTNNNAHLLLYGSSGAGKSLLLSAISKHIPTYRYLTGHGTRFQNPDILSSSIILIDEFDTASLMSNFYKQLLDIKSSVKIDFKNLHPENVSKDMPCILSTNDDVFQVLRSQLQASHGSSHGSSSSDPHRKGKVAVNSHSVEAAIRRLYPVPFKMGQYDKLHGKISPENCAHYSFLGCYNTRLQDEPDKLDRIFNLIFGFALFYPGALQMQFTSEMHQYVDWVSEAFSSTIFGQIYLTNKEVVDNLLDGLEEVMVTPDVNDTEYQVKMARAAQSLGELITTYVTQTMLYNDGDRRIFTTKSIPWQIRAFFAVDQKNHEKSGKAAEGEKGSLMKLDLSQLLNSNAATMIGNKTLNPFIMEEDKEDAMYRKEEEEEPLSQGNQILGKRTFSELNPFACDADELLFVDPFDIGNDEGSIDSLCTQWKNIKRRRKGI